MKSRFLKFSSAVEDYFSSNSDLLEELVMLDRVPIFARIASIRVLVTEAGAMQAPAAEGAGEFKFLSGYFPIPGAHAKILIANGSASPPYVWIRDEFPEAPPFWQALPPQVFDKKAWISSRNGLAHWPITLGSAYVSRRSLDAAIAENGHESEGGFSVGQWPWGGYQTEELRHLVAAAEKWWKNYDPSEPDTAPTKEEVVAWLIKRGLQQRAADRIDTILRAKDLPKGPRRPK